MSTWTLAYDSFIPEQEGLREALTSTGNGYFCTRGACEWADAGAVHYPGTYMHGGFNRATTLMAGRPVVNEDFVNFPNWLPLRLSIGGDEPLSLSNAELLDYRHEYDIRHALVRRTLRLRDRQGRETTIASRRFVSMAEQHLAALEWTITAENWSGPVEVLSALDGRVENRGVARYGDLVSRHLNRVDEATCGTDCISLLVQTRQSRIYVAEAARTHVYGEHEVVQVDRKNLELQGYIQEVLAFEVEEKCPVRVEKMVSFFSSRDNAISEPLINAHEAVRRFGTFAETLDRHEYAWDQLWARADVEIPKDEHVQRLVRFHICHLLQVCSPFTTDMDAGVPARGLNGEAYRGHVFWDELYIYPFITFRLPDVTRELLMYRYRRLRKARQAALDHGYKGAMYPWQSGSDGSEETQVVHLNPKSGRWDPDLSHNQRHVNAAIFYNIWEYFQSTNDLEFLWDHGAEMMLEIARFWASITHFNEERGRYEIHGIMGPDEFHETVYGSNKHGLPNNAYTNVMVAWISQIAQKVLDLLPEGRRDALCGTIGLGEDEIAKWREMSTKMFVPIHDDGVISQFEGYEDLEDLDWEAYRSKYDDIHRMDRILKAEGDTPDKYKVAKQADTLMLWYLFSDAKVARLLETLGYQRFPDMERKNIDYYEHRTSHGSTLSLIVHADLEAGLDPETSWDRFVTALESDVGDIQGGTTKEGIHMGVMAGTIDLLQRGYLGVDISGDALCFNPKPIDKLDGLKLPMQFRQAHLEVELRDGKLTVTALPGGIRRSLKIGYKDEMCEIKAGESRTFTL
ncbi:MAG: glycoside hydrolase family 65 protein [Rhodospirillales bacterium]|nr:glycoside hydrolase family 65 protein [Rhodospirillales bacterium]